MRKTQVQGVHHITLTGADRPTLNKLLLERCQRTLSERLASADLYR